MFSFIVFLVIISLVFIALSYNALQKLSQDIREKASNAQVSINKKLTLINQLIEVVKNYQTGEQLVHLKVSDDNVQMAYRESGNVMATIQGVADRFPNLKADSQYHRLVDSIQDCELDIQYSRQKYNHSVKQYNTKRLTIPTVFIAPYLGFPEAPYLEFDLSGVIEVSSLKEFKTDDGERLQQMFSDAGSKISHVAGQVVDAGKDLAGRVQNKENKDDSKSE